LPATISGWLAGLLGTSAASTEGPAFKAAEQEVHDRVGKLLSTKGTQSPDWYHRQFGKIMWNECGMGRTAAGLQKAITDIQALRDEYWRDVKVLGNGDDYNQALEKAGRVGDFLELGELMCRDALQREESCGGHFREEHQTEDGEARRNDEEFSFVGAWEFAGEGKEPVLHKEPLNFEYAHVATRSYK